MSTTRDLSGPLGKASAWPQVNVLFRNFVNMLNYLSQGVQAPASDVTGGVVKDLAKLRLESSDSQGSPRELLTVKSSDSEPSGAFVAVPYRGHWFYIDDKDNLSKETLSLLIIIYSLQSGTIQGTNPVLTIPVGAR
ncbi:MAG: hypothetical protein HQK56_17445 [Deltaproteobacteria bacterium]|nr:hypothetical protein [Deltaproteobacteria bacterium]